MAGEAIKFNAGINTAGFDSGAKHLQNVASSASGAITQHFGKIATAVIGIGAAFMGVRAAAQAFNAAIAMGGQLNDLSARTGESAGNLAILQRAFQNAGAGADAVGPTINRLQRAIIEAGEGGKQQAEAFAKLGLSFADIRNLSPTEQLQAVAKALQGVSNDSDRSAIAMQLLGRSGGELLPLLRAMGTELDVARGQLGSLPGVIDRTNAHLDAIGDNFAAIGEKGKEFMVGFLEKVAPALADLTTRMANIDAAGFGAKLSEYAEKTGRWIVETFKLGDALNNIELAIKGITSGDFGKGFELLFVTARITASNAINQIVAMAMAGLSSLGSFIVEVLGPDSAAFRIIKNGFDVLATNLGISLAEAILKAIEGIPFLDGVRQNIRETIDWAKDDVAMLMSWIKEDVGEVGAELIEAGKKFPTSFAAAYDSYAKSPLIDITSALAEQKQLSADLAENIKAAGVNAGAFAKAMHSNPLYAGVGVNALQNAPVPSPFPSFTRGGGANVPDPVMTPSPDGASSGGASSVPQTTNMAALTAQANNFNVTAMASLGRINSRFQYQASRAQQLAASGLHRSAAQIQARINRNQQTMAGKALQNMGQNSANPNPSQALGGGDPSDPSGASSGTKTLDDLWKELNDLNKKLPQNALTT